MTASIPDDTTPTAGGDGASFCQFEDNVNGAVTTAQSDEDFLTALSTFEPSMDAWEASAPNVQLRAAAVKIHAAAKIALASNTADIFNGDALNDAFLPISAYCAALADSAPSTSG